MTQPKTTRIPTPLYAAAGAGELALRHLRKLPAVVTELGDKAVSTTLDLGEKAVATVRGAGTNTIALSAATLKEKAVATLREANNSAASLREKAASADFDLDRIRQLAIRNASMIVANAYAAQERAMAAYGVLVARGERVIGSGVVQAAEAAATGVAEPTGTEPTGATAAAEPTPTATQQTAAEAVTSKPAKATRARATKTAAKSIAGATSTPSAEPTKTAAKRSRPVATDTDR